MSSLPTERLRSVAAALVSVGLVAAMRRLLLGPEDAASVAWGVGLVTLLPFLSVLLGAAAFRLTHDHPGIHRAFAWPQHHPGGLWRVVGLYGAGAGLALGAVPLLDFHFVATTGQYTLVVTLLFGVTRTRRPSDTAPTRRADTLTALTLGVFWISWCLDRELWDLYGAIPWGLWFALVAFFAVLGVLGGRAMLRGSASRWARARLTTWARDEAEPASGRLTWAAHTLLSLAAAAMLAGLGIAYQRLALQPQGPLDPTHPRILGVDWYFVTAEQVVRGGHLGVCVTLLLSGALGLFTRAPPKPDDAET